MTVNVRYSFNQVEEYFCGVDPIKEHIILELDNQKYLYIIQLRPVDLGRYKLKSTALSNFIPQLAEHVLHDIRNNLCKLVLDYSFETFDCTHSHKADLCNFYIQETLKHYNLSKNQVAVITGNVKAFRDVPYTVALAERTYVRIGLPDKEFVSKQSESIKNKTNRPYKLSCLMNKPRYHRVKLGEHLFSNNLLNDNIVSLNLNKRQLELLLNHPGKYDKRYDSIFKTADDFLNSLPWKFDNFSNQADLMHNAQQERLYLDTYVNIAVESLVDHTSKTNSDFELDISEKTYKPISRMQPFIVFGQQGLLEYLQGVGYKTFNAWWDESYDSEPDADSRLLKILKIIKQLSSMTQDELSNMLAEMLPILEHNKLVFDEYIENKKYMQDFEKVILAMFDK
jgi:hypothetical protein